MGTRRTSRIGRHDLYQDFNKMVTGEGLECAEIAKRLEVTYKTNEGRYNPNKELIKHIADNIKPFPLKPSGEIYSEVFNSSGGGPSGHHSHTKPLYCVEQVDYIQHFLSKHQKNLGNGLYSIYGKEFKYLPEGEEWAK